MWTSDDAISRLTCREPIPVIRNKLNDLSDNSSSSFMQTGQNKAAEIVSAPNLRGDHMKVRRHPDSDVTARGEASAAAPVQIDNSDKDEIKQTFLISCRLTKALQQQKKKKKKLKTNWCVWEIGIMFAASAPSLWLSELTGSHNQTQFILMQLSSVYSSITSLSNCVAEKKTILSKTVTQSSSKSHISQESSKFKRFFYISLNRFMSNPSLLSKISL